MAERLQKLLARAGVASRRASEDLLRDGRVTVDGRVASLGESAELAADIRVDGRPIAAGQTHVTFALHKPRNVITTANDERGRRTVLALVPRVPGLHPVGRLDRDSEGLILLTTDGDLTLRATHPRYSQDKEYRVWTDREPGRADLEALRRGIELDDGPARALQARAAEGGAWVTIGEGRNRQVRRMLEALGLEVVRLMRTRIGRLQLGDLRRGEWRELLPREVAMLKGEETARRER